MSPRPSAEALAAFYADFHRPNSEGGWYDDAEDRMQADFPAKVTLVRARVPRGRLLDVGCGKGFFVRAACDAGLDAEGVDLSTTGVDYAKQHLGVKATIGDVADLVAGGPVFDAVTCWATIEHLTDPLATVRHMASVLKPGGFLFIDTGIGDDLLDRLLPGAVQWYDPPQHLFVFSQSGLSEAVRQASLELVAVDPCFERSVQRRLIRKLRNTSAAAMLRTAAIMGRVRDGQPFGFTRFAIGNLISVVARKPP